MVINSSFGQDLSKTLELASSHLKSGDLEEAELLFRRVAFFDQSGQYEKRTVEGLAHISYSNEEYAEASGYFLSLSRISGNHLDYYYYVLSLIKGEQWMLAKAALLNLSDTTINVKASKKILLGLVEFSLRNFDDAKEHFAEAENLLSISIEDEDVFSRVEKVRKKNRTKAIVLSGILPGLGQVYSGHVKEGVNSLLLISAIGFVYYYTLTNVGILDAIVTVFPWANRYYVGGMNLAADLVDDYQAEKFLVHYNELVALYGSQIR